MKEGRGGEERGGEGRGGERRGGEGRGEEGRGGERRGGEGYGREREGGGEQVEGIRVLIFHFRNQKSQLHTMTLF